MMTQQFYHYKQELEPLLSVISLRLHFTAHDHQTFAVRKSGKLIKRPVNRDEIKVIEVSEEVFNRLNERRTLCLSVVQ